jgi:hypothetical protein
MDEELDLSGIRILPPEGEDFIDRSPLRDYANETEPLSELYTLPAQGLEALERDRFGFHVVDADSHTGLDLTAGFGAEKTVLVNGNFFDPEHLIHHIDVLSEGGKTPVRVVIRNLGGIKHEHVPELEKLFNKELGYPVKSLWLIDEGEDIDPAVSHKLLLNCEEMVDAATLLDAVAFGWGSQNAYNGEPVGGKVPISGHDKEVIPSDVPLFNKRGFLPDNRNGDLPEEIGGRRGFLP